MRFSIISVLSLVGAGMVSALPQEGSLHSAVKRSNATTEEKVHQAAAALSGKTVENESETSDCVGSLLCCGSLTTPLDHIVDPILEDLGIDAANIVGSIGLLCDPYEGSSCSSAPQCCTEANLLGGTLALGCSALKQ
ncbi:Hydrophobin [Penicillium hispanicum]|uniref:Hydrophobin n=1 Tax=Penicillium hispanicum TaxID=1080232 RepID=UPI0025401D4E|nr:Hydrophobin [Penicillium hispanicum]KAJ5591963.1 Hydrophobin [Penicillium hispanicum]